MKNTIVVLVRVMERQWHGGLGQKARRRLARDYETHPHRAEAMIRVAGSGALLGTPTSTYASC
ncbi:hypothetical protein ABT043_21725 [Streptomyces sp. NPDC002418]|uniref:hypothetical protein n=1 Tax=Streptomyces TaxID=1883 RepID=UPI00332D599B